MNILDIMAQNSHSGKQSISIGKRNVGYGNMVARFNSTVYMCWLSLLELNNKN